uniref:Uncharacterized protein n=1 Tax=Ananas comosus var. bracteatus TaxID=296719 RepID=A0A6V7Q1X8_ANACO|nr:unnamed protein product [Ananas comosus var. bracteatus]
MGETGPLSTVLRQDLRQPVPGWERPVPERVFCEKGLRDRSLAGRDRFPNVGFSGSTRETSPMQGETVPQRVSSPDRAVHRREKGKEKKENERRGACLEALEHHLLPHFSPLEAWSLLLELCGGSIFNPRRF